MHELTGKRRWLRILLLTSMLAGTCLAGGLLSFPDWPHPPPKTPLLCLALLAQLTAVLLRSWNWTSLLSLIRPSPLRTAVHSTVIGMACNCILPLRFGELVRAYSYGTALGVSRFAVFVTVLIERVCDMVILGLLCTAAAILLEHNMLGGAPIMMIGATALLAAALVLGLGIALLGSRRPEVLWMMREATGLLNDEWRDKLRISLWSTGHFLRILKTKPRRLVCFAAGLLLVWGFQIAALLLVTAALRHCRTSLQSFSQALGAYLAVGVPAAPAFVGSYQPIYTMTALAIEPDLHLNGAASASTMGFVTWALMMVPITLAGLFLLLFMPGFGFRPSVVRSMAGSPHMLRDWPRYQEMSDFLRSYFSGVTALQAAEDQDLRGRGATLRQFRGGSDASTLLVDAKGGLRVRKIASQERKAKLVAQRDWLQRHQSVGHLPRVLDWLEQDDFVQLDVEMLAVAQPFFDVLHSVPPTDSAAMLFELLTLLNTHVYAAGPETMNQDAVRDYISSKIIRKIDAATQLVPTLSGLSAAHRLVVNGVMVDNIMTSVERVLASPLMLADLARFTSADIHGDLTIDNLLVADDKLMMIDPNNENMISAPEVDLSKLCQSLHSGYEFLLRVDRVSVNGNRIDFPDRRSLTYARLNEMLAEHMKSTLPPHRYRAVRFHEAVHFTRMLPYRARIDASTLPMYYSVAAMRLNEFCQFYDIA